MIHHKDFPFDNQEEREIVHVSGGAVFKHHKWKIITLALFFAFLMFGGKYLYDLGRGSSDPMDAPLIVANNDAYKVKPEDPGGMVIPHMDKEIFNSIDENLIEKQVNITPIDTYERPLDVDPIADLIEAEKPKAVVKPKTVRVDGSSSYTKPLTNSRKAKKIDIDKVLAKQKAPEVWVQLGTFNSEDSATKAWQVLSERNIEALDGKKIRVVKSDLGDKGVFYRLQSGPLTSESSARGLCKKLNTTEQNCFPVKLTN